MHTLQPSRHHCFLLLWIFIVLCSGACDKGSVVESGNGEEETPEDSLMTHLTPVSISGKNFVTEKGMIRFWGFNAGIAHGTLMEDEWETEEKMESLIRDLKEMKALGANLIRIHLQYHRFMKSPEEPDQTALDRLKYYVNRAEEMGLYLDVTGLGSYRRDDPSWYESMAEEDRWRTQALFWKNIAKAVGKSPAVFCYNLMNEPAVASEGGTDWIPDKPFGDFYFVQNIALEKEGRSTEEVFEAWITAMTEAIREEDAHTPVTLGLLPFSNMAKMGKYLDFLSLHVYPREGEEEKAAELIRDFQSEKPLLIEEIFPLYMAPEELADFIKDHKEQSTGWLGHYFGENIEDLTPPADEAETLTKAWLEIFQEMGAEMKQSP